MKKLWSVYGSQVKTWNVVKEAEKTYSIQEEGDTGRYTNRLGKESMWLNGLGDFYETEREAVEAAIENGQAAVERAHETIRAENAQVAMLEARLTDLPRRLVF